jgi:ADP-ribose pyrophosphatase YjhB (NUDIX family)
VLARFRRAWPFGSVYTAGALIAVTSEDGCLLLVKPRYRSGWGLPGGIMKRNEQAADTLRREVLEETGLAVHVNRPHDVYVQRGRHHIDHLFLVSVDRCVEPAPLTQYEIEQAAWHPLDDLPPLQWEAVEALERAMEG